MTAILFRSDMHWIDPKPVYYSPGALGTPEENRRDGAAIDALLRRRSRKAKRRVRMARKQRRGWA